MLGLVRQGFELPTDISKDFTVIDRGEAIAVTLSFGGDNLAAEWYIKDEDRKIRFEGLCKSLLRASEACPQFEEWVKRDKPNQT
jgi:hypothetical protein